jgi:hypothetical protein
VPDQNSEFSGWHLSIGAARVDKPGSERQNRDAIRPAACCFTCCGLPVVPEWRNWQTRQLQELVLAREWRFESSFGHQNHPRLLPFSPSHSTDAVAPSVCAEKSPDAKQNSHNCILLGTEPGCVVSTVTVARQGRFFVSVAQLRWNALAVWGDRERRGSAGEVL